MPWKEFAKDSSTLWGKYGSPLWDFATHSYLPEVSDRDTVPHRLYDDFIRPLGSPLGALSIVPAATATGRALKYLRRGIESPLIGAVAPASGAKPGVLSSLRDEAKQIAMTFGLPGTGISSHGLSLATAHLKATPLNELPKEAYDTARMLWNPERAVAENKTLTGGINPFRLRQEIIDDYTQKFPHLNPNGAAFKDAVEKTLDSYAAWGPGTKSSRFKDILDLERPTSIGGGGLKTSDILAGTSKGSLPERQIATHPLNVKLGGKNYNLNPLSWQKEMFDTPLFGEDYINTYFKRKTALREFDRLSALKATTPRGSVVPFGTTATTPNLLSRQEALEGAANMATNFMGGFGADSPHILNSKLAKWSLTAPDWTRRHFALANQKIQSVTNNITNPLSHPYRRALAYDAAGLGLTGAANYALNNQMPSRAQDVFNIELPKNSDYSTRDVFDPFSTEMDLPKTAFSIANSIGPQAGFYAPETKGFYSLIEPIYNRLHPFPARPALELLANKTRLGGTIMGEEPFTKPHTDLMHNVTYERPDIPQVEELKRIAKSIGGSVSPQAVDTLINEMQGNLATGGGKRLSPLAAASQMFELPFRAYTPRYSKVETPFDRRMKRLDSKFNKFDKFK